MTAIPIQRDAVLRAIADSRERLEQLANEQLSVRHARGDLIEKALELGCSADQIRNCLGIQGDNQSS